MRSALLSLMLLLVPGPARASRVVHEVMPGESLSAIARRYGTTPERIRRLNRLKSDRLRNGQKLEIRTSAPARGQRRSLVEVRKGETLARLARRHHMKLSLLRRMNPGAGSKLRPGQRLWVVREEEPSKGSDQRFYRLEPGPGFEILDPRRAWGTMLTVSRVAEVLSEHGISNLEKPPILVGDISRQRGGFLPPHHSHRRGRDVDIRYPRVRPTRHYVPVTAATLDVKRTWSLIKAFILTGDVVYVFVDRKLQKVLYEQARTDGLSREKLDEFFQYPRSGRAMAGIIRHEPGHATHFHVRFKAEPAEGPNS